MGKRNTEEREREREREKEINGRGEKERKGKGKREKVREKLFSKKYFGKTTYKKLVVNPCDTRENY